MRNWDVRKNAPAHFLSVAIRGGVVVFSAWILGAPLPTQAQSFEESLIAAYQANPKLKAQQARTRVADELVPQALSNWRPSLALTGDIGRKQYSDNQSATSPDGKLLNPHNVGLTVSQPVFRGFQTVAGTEAAEERVRAERARLRDVEQTVLLEAATAYLRVARDQQLVQLQISHVQVLEKELESAQDGFRIGTRTRTDVSQAEARLARSHADRTKAEANLAASVAAYQNVVGLQPGPLKIPTDVPRLPPNRATAEKSAADHNPLVAAAYHDRGAARETVRVAHGELLPTISLNASSTKSFEALNFDQKTTDNTVKAVINIPLYQGGVSQARVRQAKQSEAEQALRVDVARRDAVEAATRSWDAVLSARERLRAQETEINAATLALEGVRRELAIGGRTLIDALNAEQELLDARTEDARTRVDYMIAAFQLLQATGQLSTENLGLNVERYRPEDHYKEVRNSFFSLSASGEAQPKSEPVPSPPPAPKSEPVSKNDKSEASPVEPPPQTAPTTPVEGNTELEFPLEPADFSLKDAPIAAPRATAEPPAPIKPARSTGGAAATARATRVQLAALRTEAQAREAWTALLKSHADLFEGLTPEISRLDLGGNKGIYYRLQVAPPSTKTPRDFCQALKARHQACFVVSPG